VKTAILWLALGVFLSPNVSAQGAQPQGSADKPYVMEFYYKTGWGHQKEFLDLFLKNHFPLLREIEKSGRILALKIETPANHMTEDSRWDYRVTIVYKNSTVATTANPEEDALIKKLYPDQAAYQKEEQRRFEILQAHWDLPVSDVTPARK
jgi:hypothetical protein